MVRIEGAGIAGRVLRHELARAGIASVLTDRSEFPRPKVCGGVLQWESWRYLKENFALKDDALPLESMSHHWRGRRMESVRLSPPAVFISRLALDVKLETPSSPDAVRTQITVNATGVPHQGEWIGFQSQESANVQELEMHYGRGICLGLSPTPEKGSHAAFIVKRGRFREISDLRLYVRKELGVELSGDLKGTGRIHYGDTGAALAVGDAKMTTFPFLGLGMKHAIESARLLAACLADGDPSSYPGLHRKQFRRQRLAGAWAARLYDSPFQGVLRPFVSNPFLFERVYRWLHH